MLLASCTLSASISAQADTKTNNQKPSKVCLTDDNDVPFNSAALESMSQQARPYAQLLDTQGNQLLPASTYKLPLGFEIPTNGCFEQPFILTHGDKTYQWFDTNGEVLYDVYWFDNGPDYPQESLFRFKQNELIGYADAETFEIIIPAQYQAAHPFKGEQAEVSYKADIEREAGEHSVWVNTDYFIIDKLGNTMTTASDN